MKPRIASLNMLKQIFCGIFFRWRILTDDNIYLSCNYGYYNVLFTFVAYLCHDIFKVISK
jgi:hypothetical protein